MGSTGDSSSEVSAIVMSDRVEMLTEGDWVAGDVRTISGSEIVTDSSGDG